MEDVIMEVEVAEVARRVALEERITVMRMEVEEVAVEIVKEATVEVVVIIDKVVEVVTGVEDVKEVMEAEVEAGEDLQELEVGGLEETMEVPLMTGGEKLSTLWNICMSVYSFVISSY